MTELHSSSRPTRTPPDDLSLIQQFVEGVMSSQPLFLSNPSFRTDHAFETYQLFTSRDGILVTAKLTESPLTVLVNWRSPYWELVHQALVAKQLFPVGDAPKEGFYRYQYQTAPAGYRLHCNSAMEFWRTWWTGGGRHRQLGISLELLISRRGTWYPVKDIICSRGTLFVKTLGGEATLIGSDMLIWLQKLG